MTRAIENAGSSFPAHSEAPRNSRREFLRSVGLISAGMIVPACDSGSISHDGGQAQDALPVDGRPGSEEATGGKGDTRTSAPKVSIAKAESYQPGTVSRSVQGLLDGIGGLSDSVKPGDRVVIKINLTGGAHYSPPAGVSAVESYMTHPEVVRAVAQACRDAGAREIFIAEAFFDEGRYGFDDLAQTIGASIIDLNEPAPYAEFASVKVGGGSLAYEEFTLNRRLTEADLFVSISKMKCHYNCGVTHTLKNLVGLVPCRFYRSDQAHWHRSALHGADDDVARERLPKVIVDLARARPVQLSVIDGIKAAEGGEVPRGDSFGPVSPGVLVAGKDPVATDAVATAVMGFDPMAEYPAEPFLHGKNHLNLAQQRGLGTNRLAEIQVVGASIDSVRFSFRPAV